MISVFPKTLIATRFLSRTRPRIHTPKLTAIRTMSSSTQRMFQLKLDPITGNSEWVVIEDNDDGDESFAHNFHQPLLATTSYLDMLNDSPRNTAFRQAIQKTITKPCHVLDIGAGTGLLSMMAARAMGDEGRVTACESYLPMVKLMKKVLRINGMEGRVKVINKRSDELEVGLDIPSRADALVSEILDSELLGEGLIPTLQHAHDNLLVENALTVPYRATTYGQLVESTFLWQLHDLHSIEATVSDGIQLTPPGLDSVLSVKRQQYAMHCNPIQEEIKLLSEASHVMSLLPGLKERGLQYLQAAAHANGLSRNCIEVLEKRVKQLTMHDIHQKKVDLLIAEPFYVGHDGMLPWQNLRFWKDRTTLNDILSEDALIIPSKGILRACAISLPDLWKSRCCLSNVEGFDHSVVNATLGACSNLPELEEGPCLPFFVWQCGEFDVLSETFDVMEFDFSKQICLCQGKSQVKFTKTGVCHGFVLWIDWVMDLQNSVVISTGPDRRYWKQGVKLLGTPRTVGPQRSRNVQACSAVLEACFNPLQGELKIILDFL
uniref:Protein arginine N-methyltransferase domain-containing protein n=1 Tax=Glycine max TaxID=3847 RepID=A0A0R0JYU5_SOYBN